MATQKQTANKKVIFWKNTWCYYVFFHQNNKTTKSGPWSEDIALALRNDLLISNICAWIKKLDENE
jgi:hypothetical protein